MSAAPHETGTPTPPVGVLPERPAPSLVQLLGQRSARAQARPQAHPPARPQIRPQPLPQAHPQVRPPAGSPVRPPARLQPAPARPETARPQAARPQAARPQAARPQAARPQAPALARPQGGPAAATPLREPTFDELVSGYGRHRGPQEQEFTGSLLRRLALRARLLPTPARRPPARATGTR